LKESCNSFLASADDGDPADVLVITPYPLIHDSVITVRPIGVLRMTDEAGRDYKILGGDESINKHCTCCFINFIFDWR
jgi:inorganic pyrophosphatase